MSPQQIQPREWQTATRRPPRSPSANLGCVVLALLLPACTTEVDPIVWRSRILQAAANGEALTAQQLEADAEALVAFGGPTMEPSRRFIRAHASFRRGENAARQAEGPEAEPGAYRLAIRHVEDARAAFEELALQSTEWRPTAHANQVRMEHALQVLRARQADAEAQRATQRSISTDGSAQTQIFVPRALLDRILDKIDLRELEKMSRQRADPDADQPVGESAGGRDW